MPDVISSQTRSVFYYPASPSIVIIASGWPTTAHSNNLLTTCSGMVQKLKMVFTKNK